MLHYKEQSSRTILPKIQNHSDFIFVNKFTNINTHAADEKKLGLVEVLEKELNHKLFVVHRLDKETSGALVFAKSTESARLLAGLFQNQLVHKEYLFLTDRISTKTYLQCETYIRKEGNQFVSDRSNTPNSKTEFHFIKKINKYFLWKAVPHTGKTHQIRLHALDQGLPILGDKEHQGTPFIRLCLHSACLRFQYKNENYDYQAPLPFWAQESLFDSERITSEETLILNSLDMRSFYYETSPQDSLRLIHTESHLHLNDEFPFYKLDQFAHTWWLYWYQKNDPSDENLKYWADFAQANNKNLIVRKMLNRGQNPNAEITWKFGSYETRWVAYENNVAYEIRTDCGLSPGLFLDQRENRFWIKNQSEGKKVLNLFSYTGGFSINAAIGGAKEVASVDLSQTIVQWSQSNWLLNKIPLSPQFEFWTQDVFLFLKGAAHKKRTFDLIICDPPSFSRSKNGLFRVEKDFEKLISSIWVILEPKGQLLFCTNFEGWNEDQLNARFYRLGFKYELIEPPLQGLDYEHPGHPKLLKTLIVRKIR